MDDLVKHSLELPAHKKEILLERLIRERKCKPEMISESRVITGSMPTTPLMELCFSGNNPNHHNPNLHNISLLFDVDMAVNYGVLCKSIEHLILHHDALRIRFKVTEFGLDQFICSPGGGAPVSFIDISALSREESSAAIEKICDSTQKCLNLLEGPSLRAALFFLGPLEPQRLLFVVSHKVCDAISLGILMGDFIRIYTHILHRREISLPQKTTSIKDWQFRKNEYLHSEAGRRELMLWDEMAWEAVTPLPIDSHDGRALNTWGSERAIDVYMDEQNSYELTKLVPAKFGVNLADILIAVLVQTIGEWANSAAVGLFLVSNGRITPFPDIDLSRTVGWIAPSIPIVLESRNAGELEDYISNIGRQVSNVSGKSTLWEWPYTKYLQPVEIQFNNQISIGERAAKQLQTAEFPFRSASEFPGDGYGYDELRVFLLHFIVRVLDGKLNISLRYSQNVHHYSTVEMLLNRYIDGLCSVLAYWRVRWSEVLPTN